MGPLGGLRIVEIASIGPGPFCATLLADMGADVTRVDRVDAEPGPAGRALLRSRRSIRVDLKREAGIEVLLRLVDTADGILEGFRPGVAERLGFGPEVCWERNSKLVYGRMTGWGQTGPRAQTAGHDIDYLALSGLLHTIGSQGGPPVPPLNLVADYGGGGMLLAFGMMAALWEAERSGHGQVVDAAMIDGAALLGTQTYELWQAGLWEDQRGVNLLDGGAPFYTTYETEDGRYVAVGALERPFFAELIRGLGLQGEELPDQYDRSRWPELRDRLAAVFSTRSRDEWVSVFAATDACLAPVLSLAEAADDPHNRARGTFEHLEGRVQPGPAPRFSRTTAERPHTTAEPGRHTAEILQELAFSLEERDRLFSLKVVA